MAWQNPKIDTHCSQSAFGLEKVTMIIIRVEDDKEPMKIRTCAAVVDLLIICFTRRSHI